MLPDSTIPRNLCPFCSKSYMECAMTRPKDGLQHRPREQGYLTEVNSLGPDRLIAHLPRIPFTHLVPNRAAPACYVQEVNSPTDLHRFKPLSSPYQAQEKTR